jgi:hypothetical protein
MDALQLESRLVRALVNHTQTAKRYAVSVVICIGDLPNFVVSWSPIQFTNAQ